MPTKSNSSGTLVFDLLQNYPNPFNPTTTISLTIPSDGHVRLRVYDMLGRVVQQLVDENRAAGAHHVVFEGSRLPSAVYIYRLEFNGTSITKKLILAK
ncbi:MAG: T9SS type A sorting domain-containing protein [Bacteroidota bacterium]